LSKELKDLLDKPKDKEIANKPSPKDIGKRHEYKNIIASDINEGMDADAHTAMELAKEMNKDIDDLGNILASGSKTGGGNPHNINSLRQSIVSLDKEIKELGYHYDPKSPGMIRKAGDKSFTENKEQDYGPEYQDMVKRVGQLAKEGPRKTVYDPVKRVYKTVPVNQQKSDDDIVKENLRQWFKEKWVRFGPDGKIRGACARGDDSEGKPKCLPQAKAHALGKKGRKYAAAKKRREDPNPERRGPAKNVATKKKSNEGVAEGLDNRSFLEKVDDYLVDYTAQAKGNGYVWIKGNKAISVELTPTDPGIVNWALGTVRGSKINWLESGNDRESDTVRIIKAFNKQGVAEAELDEACWKGYHKEGNKKMFGKTYPNCVKNTNESEEGDLYVMALQRYPKLKQVDRELVVSALNNAYEDYLMHYGYEGIGPDEENSLIDYAIKNMKHNVNEQELDEKWSQKYKDSINCSNPKGFSQKAHCAGKKKNNESLEKDLAKADYTKYSTPTLMNALKTLAKQKNPNTELQQKISKELLSRANKQQSAEKCPHCGGPIFNEMIMNEKKDACYYKVKSRYKVWPSAYASGALVKCRKKGASNWGNKSK
jgi:hypothetical protein